MSEVADARGGLPGIDRPRVTRWLGTQVPGLCTPVGFTLIAGGRSNLTYRVTDANGVARALRRPPTGGVLSTAHDMSREWRFISALTGTGVPVPGPLAYCADTAVTGAEFYVKDFVDGVVLGDRAAASRVSEPVRHRAGLATVDVMVALHQVDPDEAGLGTAARRDGYLARQLKRWQRQVHQSGVADLAVLDQVHDALAARIPPQVSGIVHGDLRPGNICYRGDGSVAAIFDWELATLGDPLADLGWLLSTWVDPDDELPPTTAGPNAEPGFPSRAELVERYARGSGRDVSNVPYYLAFARWRAACIAAGVHARYLAGVMGEDDYVVAERGRDVARLVEASHVTAQRLRLL